ncbi:MAG: FAD-dependent oxidoreductase [Actinomycetota bacterium]|nr:FAD-dependent oxidoreductase [Actinomycetota bacterium]
MGSVTVVGASLAGLSTVRALRSRGFDGRVVVVGAEPHAPYDRPPLSKAFLAGTATETDLALLGEDDAELGVEWRLGVPAAGLDAAEHAVTLADGDVVRSDAVVLATGSRARQLPGAHELAGVHVLRTLDDAVALRDDLAAGGRLVVVGGGFIGAEVASTAQARGLVVTVVEAMPTPLAGPLGPEMGAVCGALHADHGVRLLTGVGVAGLVGTDRVQAVDLLDGTRLPADIVVVGVGALPNVEWLVDSGLDTAGGIATDASCATTAPGIVAVGDCARSYDVHARRPVRIEHWTHALQQPATAAATLLGGSAPYTGLPYFWSEQYGLQIQLVGSRAEGDVVTVVHGTVDERSFVATYEREGRLVAVLGVGATGPFSRWRRTLRAAAAADVVLAG